MARIMASSEPLPSAPASDLRRRILSAATQLFAERGYAATSMRDLADAVSCTKPALYYYFESKAGLFREVIRIENERIIALLQHRLATPGSVRERMRGAMHAYFEHLRAQPLALRLLLRAEQHVEHGQPALDFRSMRQAYVDLVTGLMHQGIAAGEIRGDVAVDDAIHLLCGAVDVRASRFILDGEPIPEDYPERILALVFEGIAP
jgi:TetR/AcrR family transcriptional regulator